MFVCKNPKELLPVRCLEQFKRITPLKRAFIADLSWKRSKKTGKLFIFQKTLNVWSESCSSYTSSFSLKLCRCSVFNYVHTWGLSSKCLKSHHKYVGVVYDYE
jgi:hypothetical protein